MKGETTMKLMTKELENRLAKYPLYSQDGKGKDETMVIAKFFFPVGNWTWYVTEGNKTENGDWEFYGYVVGDFPEFGYFTLSELESVNVRGLMVERDMYFKPCKLTEVVERVVY